MTNAYLVVPLASNVLEAIINTVDSQSLKSRTEIAIEESASDSRQQTVSMGWTVDLLGEKYLAAAKRHALVWVLRRLQDLDDSFLGKLSHRVVGTKRIVGRSPEHLYPIRPDLRHETREICPGWWADCLLSKEAVHKRLQIACDVAGLQFGVDLRVNLDVRGIKPRSIEDL